jgi:hypothetical protein
MTDLELAEAWIRFQQKPEEEPDVTDPDWVAVDAVMGIGMKNPEHLMRMIGLILELTDDDDVLGDVGAGPLEDLLRAHGQEYGPQVIDKARDDPRWREAYKSVWIFGFTDETTQRLLQQGKVELFGGEDAAWPE